MQSTDSLDSLEALVQALKRLPGVGVKSAARMAFHLLQRDREGALVLSQALAHAVSTMQHCTRCHTFTEGTVCAVCLDPERDATRLCVVETPADQAALERTSAFDGLYFVLMGRISPLDGVGVHDIGTRAMMVLPMLACQMRMVAQPLSGRRRGSISPIWMAHGPTAADRLPQFPLQSTNGWSMLTWPNK